MDEERSGWFIYSFVARGTMVLAEYTEFTGNFPAIAAHCLQKLPSSNSKFAYSCDQHIFNFLVHDGYAYCVVAKESAPKHVSVAFLERLKADFRKRYGGGKADTAAAKSLNKEFSPVIKEHMQYIIDHAEEIEKLVKVKAQVSEIKSVMLDNIDKPLSSSSFKIRNHQLVLLCAATYRLLTEERRLMISKRRPPICAIRLKTTKNKANGFGRRCGFKT